MGSMGRANQRAEKKQSNRNQSDDATWCSRRLTAKEKEAFERDVSSRADALMATLSTLLEEGYRFSLTYDAYSGMKQVTVYTYDTADRNFGKRLSARASDPIRALYMAIWKSEILFEHQWIPDDPSTTFEEG